MTLTQKILCHHAVGLPRPWVQVGDVLRVRVDWTIASELAWNGMNATYERLGRPGLSDPARFYLALDHTVDPITLARDPRTQRLVTLSRDFAREAGLRYFYDANTTIMHTKFYEDLVQPGQLVIGADSHTSSHGGLGAVAIGLGGADVCVAMVLGETWLQVPEAIQVCYNGVLPFGLTGKDVILKTLGDLGRNTVAMERSVEYVGDALEHFSTDFRFTVANMTAEFGGLNGIFAGDRRAAAVLARRQDQNADALFFRADPNAEYAERLVFELGRLVPQVAKPFSPDNVFPVDECVGRTMDGVFIGACTTTEEELVLAALVLREGLARGLRPQPSSNRLVVPGSADVTRRLRANDLLSAYEEAGFRLGPPGCSMCLGIASDKAGVGEHWLSSQNRNFENRMGPGSIAWLASAPTVAASSFALRITDPRPLLAGVSPDDVRRCLAAAGAPPEIHLKEPTGQPVTSREEGSPVSCSPLLSRTKIVGRVQRFGENVDTDAIIPGEFCHLTEPADLARAAFHHVRPDFSVRVGRGEDVIVAGEGWGSGSSREHAAWALKYAGVKAVVARSFAYIHRRNLVNEALPSFVVTDPEFHASVRDGDPIRIDPERETAIIGDRSFRAVPARGVAFEIEAAGGIVAAFEQHGLLMFDTLTNAQTRSCESG
jgi:aconitate hydratase/homoaconitate hydratase